jgi:hypothetical protein
MIAGKTSMTRIVSLTIAIGKLRIGIASFSIAIASLTTCVAADKKPIAKLTTAIASFATRAKSETT